MTSSSWCVVCLFGLLLGAALVSELQAQPHAFSVEDSVRMIRFNTPSENLESDAPLFSPDGASFIVITSKGLPETNEIESSIWLYKTEEVQRAVDWGGPSPIARQLLRVRSIPESETPSAHAPVIAQVRWSPNAQRLYFLGEGSGGRWRLCYADLRHKGVQYLTRPRENVRYYSFTRSTVVFLSAEPARDEMEASARPSPKEIQVAQSIRGRSIESLLIRDDPGHPVLARLWELRGSERRALGEPYVDAGFGGAYTPDVLEISPDGRNVIQSRPATVVPSSWQNYAPVPGFAALRIDPASPSAHSPYNSFRPRQFVQIDLATGRKHLITDAPIAYTFGYADQQSATWSKDGRRAIITGTFLSPQSQEQDPSSTEYKHPCAAALLDARSRQITCLERSRWDLLDQRTNPEALLLTSATLDHTGTFATLKFEYPGRRSVVERYGERSGRWLKMPSGQKDDVKDTTVAAPHGLSVSIRQAVDHRPVLWASDEVHPDGYLLWDPNPELGAIAMGEVKILHWKDASGYEWTGGLIKPVGYVAKKRYPLVIQTHGFAPFQFLTDGYYPSAMAAQPLASAGFMVLQIDTRRTHYTTAQEVADQLDGYDSAIDELNREGLIDPARVGLAGFSRTSWYVESALVSEPHRFAAATIADGVDQGYLQYQLFSNTANITADSETIHGGIPYGANLATWTQHAPSFHSDKIEVPLLIQALGTRSVLMEWEIYSALYHQGKPVDLVLLPNAQHVLQSPHDLIASEQAVVDWFRFWLQGCERSTEDTRQQYARWGQIRESGKSR